MTNGAHGIENDEDDVRKEDDDMEESPLHSAISKFNDNSQFKEEEKYMSASLKSPHKNFSKTCQIDTNEKMSLEEQEARKSLLNIHSSQVGKKVRER